LWFIRLLPPGAFLLCVPGGGSGRRHSKAPVLAPRAIEEKGGASMRTILTRSKVGKGQLVLAVVLLLGVLVMAYGYFQHSKAGIYIGAAVIVAGVLNGIVQMIGRGDM
jgi:uncharacterized membrane protein